jgi:5,10-methylenetetrahydromethanopterin reductase
VTAIDLGVLPRSPAAEVAGLAVEAERLGLDGVWLADSQSIFRDPFAVLALVASRTERIRLATAVTNPVTRHPAVLASAFATLDELSDGRVVVGIGKGESSVYTVGLRPATLAGLEEAVVALRALMAGETAQWGGRELRLTWPARRVPVVVGATGPQTLQLAGRVADGVLFQVGVEPELALWALARVEEGAREAGRTLDDLIICARVGCSVDEDRARARREMEPYATVAAKTVFDAIPSLPADLAEEATALRKRYDYLDHGAPGARHRALLTDRVLDAVAVAGTPNEVVARLLPLLELGLDRIVLTAAVSDPLRLLRTLTAAVLPRLREVPAT